MECSRNDAIKAIRAALRKRHLRYSVTGGRGTAWGWIHIDLMPAEFKAPFSPEHSAAINAKRAVMYRAFGLNPGMESGSISVAASRDYYQEYIDRANGRAPSVIGQPYWD